MITANILMKCFFPSRGREKVDKVTCVLIVITSLRCYISYKDETVIKVIIRLMIANTKLKGYRSSSTGFSSEGKLKESKCSPRFFDEQASKI